MSVDGQDGWALWGFAAEQSAVSMCLVGLDGTLWMPNHAFAEMIGYTQAELRDKTFEEITHPDDVEEDRGLLRSTLRGERSSYRLVKRYLHADGGVVWGDLSVTLIRSADGAPVHFISLVLDVTAQRLHLDRLAHAMEAAEHERNLSRAILDTVDVGLVLVDRNGDYKRVNRRQHDIMAMVYPNGVDGLGGELGHLYAADGHTKLTDEEMPVARAGNGEEFDDERIWVGTDPTSRRALSVSARTVRTAAGEFVGAALAFSDVTDLVKALRAREVFESSVSHELRTPLTTVLGHLELLIEDGDLPEAAAHQLRIVQRNATRLRYLVSDLLDPASRGQEAVRLFRSSTDVTELVAETGDSMMLTAQRADVTLTTEGQVSVRGFVDADRLRQVIENLVANAVKYTDPGGRVDLRLEVASDDATDVAGEEAGGLAGDVMVITVADSGIGIDAEDIERLFDPFFRTGRARESMSTGLGLGLGIAQSITVAHGGRIEVTSTTGEGSTFRIVLPLDADDDEPGLVSLVQ